MTETLRGALGSGGAMAARLPLHAGFLLTGVVTVLLGPLLPELSREWGLPVEDLAPLFVAQFLASAVGALLSSYRQGLSLKIGYLLIAVGLLLLAVARWPVALAPVAVIGLGLGLAIPATNLRVAHSRPTRRGAALSSANLVWGAGAVACPLAFAVRPRGTSGDAVLWMLALATGLVLLFLVRAVRVEGGRATEDAAGVGVMDSGAGSVSASAALPAHGESRAAFEQPCISPGGAAPRSHMARCATSQRLAGRAPDHSRRDTDFHHGLLRQPRARGGEMPALAVIATILFLYVGIENAVGGWLVSLADQFQPARSATSLWIGAGFWAALLGGRAAAPFLLRRMSERALYSVGIAVAGLGLLGLLLSGSQTGAAVSAVAVGAGLAPLFPLTISFLAELTASTRSRSTGWVFALAGTGGAALPWLTGQLAGGADRLAAGFAAPLAALTLLALLFALLRRVDGTTRPRQPAAEVHAAP